MGWRTSSASWSPRSSRSGWPARPARPRCGSRSRAIRRRSLFGKLYARSHLRSDRWYKLGRELLYGRLEDEKPFNTVRRLVQQEDYALSLMHRAGLPSPTPLRLRRAHPRAGVPARHRVLRRRRGAGRGRGRRPGHRRRPGHHPQAVGRRPRPPRHQAGQPAGPRRPHAADRRRLRPGPAEPVAPGRRPGQHDAVPGPALQPRAGLRAGPAQFSVQEITEGFAAARGLALPSQLRRMLRAQGRDLHAEFVRLLPTPPQPISIQRWSPRRVGLMAATLSWWGCWSPWSWTRPPTTARSRRRWRSAASAAPTWSRYGSRRRPCRRLRWCPACGPLPVGWSLGDVAVNDGRSVIALHHDRAGGGRWWPG